MQCALFIYCKYICSISAYIVYVCSSYISYAYILVKSPHEENMELYSINATIHTVK